MEDELSIMIRDAFDSELRDIGMSDSVRVTDIIQHQDSDRYTIHLRHQGNQSFSSHIDPTEVLTDIKGARLTVDAFKKFARRELQKHFPDKH